MASAFPRLCCLDMDTFFVSVERLLDPSLVGQPVIVGGQPGSRGVVTACSYEVRGLGVRSGMSLTQAGKLAPKAIFLPVRQGTYGGYAEKVRRIASRYSPVIQVASIDEMFLDFSGCEGLYRRPEDADADATVERTVRELSASIWTELGLPSSAGIATSRSMAKVASGLAKPAGVRLVRAGQEREVLAPLPVRKLPGIGPVAERKLRKQGIETLGQLADMPLPALRRVFGAWATSVWRAANGQGSEHLERDRPAFQEHDPAGGVQGSISNECTFREDTASHETARRTLSSLSERVCHRARKRGVKATTVSLKLRYCDFETLTRSKSVPATDSEHQLMPVVWGLYQKARRSPRPIRLLGVALSGLSGQSEQLELFSNASLVHEPVDEIRQRFGYGAVRLASSGAPTRSARGPLEAN